jgi:uncharacterized membrane protein
MMRRWLDRALLRMRSLTRGEEVDGALRREIHDHLEEQIAENRAAGMNAREARAAALRDFGPRIRIEEECRDTRRTAFFENIARDLRYSLRSLTRQPLLVFAATLSIGAGTGASAAILTLVNELLLAPPSARQADRLAYIQFSNGSHVSYSQWRDLDRSAALGGLAGYQIEIEVNWTGPERSISLMPLAVTANFFDVVGVPVALGRGFTAAEAQAEQRPDVAIISNGFWRNRLGSDPGAIGRALVFNGRPYTVIGILPAELRTVVGFGVAPEVYLPLSRDLMPGIDDRRSAAVQLIGRLSDGQSLAAGRAALQAAAGRLDESSGSKEFGTVTQFAPCLL